MTWPTLTATEDEALRGCLAAGDPASIRIQRPDLAVIAVTGKHRGRFLHALLTQAVDETAVGSSSWACLCNAQGRILAIAQVIVRTDDIALITDRGGAQALVDGLWKFRVAERVRLALLPEVEVSCDALHLRPAVMGDGESAIALPDNALGALRAHRGVPSLGDDIDDGSTPLEVGLWDAVHWKKGCYLGQEAIAMMAYRGKIRRHLCWVEGVEGTPQAGLALRTEAGKRAGTLGSGYIGADGTALGLAMIQRRAFSPGAEVTAKTDDGDLIFRARVRETTRADAFDADPSAPVTELAS